MRILLIRHAEPDYTVDSLTPKGRVEAELLSHRLIHYEIRDFYVSPLGRAKDTAAYTLSRLDRTAEEIDPKLRSFIEQRVHATVYDNQTECFETDKALASFRRRLGNPADYGSQNHLLVICAGALVGYADSLLRCDAVAMRELTVYSESQYLMMDANTRRNL